MEVLTSLKALRNHVDPSQLPEALEGPFPYHHREWVQFFQVSTSEPSISNLSSPLPFPTLPHGSLNPVKNGVQEQIVIQETFTMKVQSSPSKASSS